MLDLKLETVDLELQERVAWITLNRPASLNAFTPQMGRELMTALDHVADAPEVRALVLTGAGRGFSSGADLKHGVLRDAEGKPDLLSLLREVFHPLILRLRAIDKPVIAAVNGGAVGFGCSLALAADLVVAERSAYFLLAFANVGLTLDGGSTALLVGRAGHGRASEMGLLAERVDAEHGAGLGTRQPRRRRRRAARSVPSSWRRDWSRERRDHMPPPSMHSTRPRTHSWPRSSTSRRCNSSAAPHPRISSRGSGHF